MSLLPDHVEAGIAEVVAAGPREGAELAFALRSIYRSGRKHGADIARELLEALPRCSHPSADYRSECGQIATWQTQGTPDTGGGPEPIEPLCDEHGYDEEIPYAAAVRKLREVLG